MARVVSPALARGRLGVEACRIPTGRTLVQITSEPTKPLSLLTSLLSKVEHGEGPPNRPWRQVYGKASADVAAGIEPFRSDLTAAMEPFSG